jgi:fatty acid desaturase
MQQAVKWDPFTQWRHADIPWIKVNISREDLGRFTKRSNFKGLLQSVGFLLLMGVTGGLSYLAFSLHYWGMLAICLYVHGSFYTMFNDALHELSHNTVFASRTLNIAVTALFGWLYWPMNPHFYRLSHQKYHHRYTLYQGSDGEDVPNYVALKPLFVFSLFGYLVQFRQLIQCLWRLFTLAPLSKGWRGRGFALDSWEQFVLKKASEAERRQVRRMGVACLIAHIVFAAVCIYFGLWFLPVLVTLAPFYGGTFLGYLSGIHQHAACEPNNPDFRISCADVKLDPLSSFLYWHMEYHIEHHMFAAIPCYNLKRFARFVADQLPPMKPAVPRLLELNRVCKVKYGSYKAWRDGFGLYKGF